VDLLTAGDPVPRRRLLLGLAGIGVGGLAAGRLAAAGRGRLEAARPPRPGGEIWSSGAGGGAFYNFAAAGGIVCFAASAGDGYGRHSAPK